MNSYIAPKEFLPQLLNNPPLCATHLDTPLLQFSDHQADCWTMRDSFEGTVVLGRSGSGKSSGALASIARSFLANGYGGLVMCATDDEADNWLRYAEETGRSADMIRFDGSGDWRFNFLEYQMQQDHLPPDVLASNLVSTLQTIIEVATRASGMSAGRQGDVFWEKSSRMFLMMAVDLLYAATGRVRLAELIDLINSAPTSTDELKSQQWQDQSFLAKTIRDFVGQGGPHPPSFDDALRLKQFWGRTFPNMTEKTRSNIVTTLLTDLDPFLRGQMRTLFSTDTNVVPEMTHDGAVILMDFPTLEWNESGTLAQMVMQYLWMRSTSRRKVTDQSRPIFYFADEAQEFLSGHLMRFQAVARRFRCACVMASQNLPSFYAKIGGDQPHHVVNAMMGNLRTKIFHNNQCTTTNQWATEIIGKETVWRQSFNQQSGWNEGTTDGWSEGVSISDSDSWSDSSTHAENIGVSSGAGRSQSWSMDGEGRHSMSIGYSSNVGDNSGSSTTTSSTHSGSRTKGRSGGKSGSHSQSMSGGRSYGVSEQRDYTIEPHEFGSQLLTGGDHNNRIVTGVVTLPGRLFKRNGKHWMQVAFQQ